MVSYDQLRNWFQPVSTTGSHGRWPSSRPTPTVRHFDTLPLGTRHVARMPFRAPQTHQERLCCQCGKILRCWGHIRKNPDARWELSKKLSTTTQQNVLLPLPSLHIPASSDRHPPHKFQYGVKWDWGGPPLATSNPASQFPSPPSSEYRS